MLPILLIAAALATVPPVLNDPDEDQEAHAPQTEIVVTGQRLDAARAKVEPSLGASTYTLTNDTIENRPGGETRDLGSILLQVPSVRRDAQGSLVVRGAPGGVQYRLNNVILPSGVADFGDTLSARLADKTELITGALPAQYGLIAGGVVNVTTKSGLNQGNSGQAELYGGSHGTIEPAFELSAASGGSSLFASGSLRRSSVGLPSPGPLDSAHAAAREVEGFAYFDQVIDADSRVSLIAGTSNERNQIPALGVAGIARSDARRGEQRTANHYAIATYQRSTGELSLQASLSGLVSRETIGSDQALGVAIDGVSLGRRERRGDRHPD